MAKTIETKKTKKRATKTGDTDVVAVSPFDDIVSSTVDEKVKVAKPRTTAKRAKTTAKATDKPERSRTKVTKAAAAKHTKTDAFAETVETTAKPVDAKAKKVVPKKRTNARAKTNVPLSETVSLARVAAAADSAFDSLAEVEFVPVDDIAIDGDATQIDDSILNEEPAVELSPVFKALADVTLPDLKRENRAQLLMQSPTRLYFYWSIKKDPFTLLGKVFDGGTNYSLVLKLTELISGREEIHLAEPVGNWWFAVEPNGRYQAEIGFYAVGRPYFRIVYSNVVETPRRSPSPRRASEAEWSVNADKFAEVLDVSGFKRDAYDVAIAGDDAVASDDVTAQAFRSFLGGSSDLSGVASDEMRYAMLALAGGMPLEALESRISAHLFAILSANAEQATAGRASATLSDYFEIDEAEFVEEEFGSAVFGASRVNFPSSVRSKRLVPKYSPRYNPVSSHSIG